MLTLLLLSWVWSDTTIAQAPPEEISAYRLQFVNSELSALKGSAQNKAEKVFNPTSDVSDILKTKLDSVILKNKKFKYAQGYRILVHSGTSSEEVVKIKDQLSTLVPLQPIYSVYKQPTFRIKLGDYADRVEAVSILYQISKDFPNAIVVQDQIMVLKEKPSEVK